MPTPSQIRDQRLDALETAVKALQTQASPDLSLYATTSQLNTEAAIRKGADDSLSGRVSKLENPTPAPPVDPPPTTGSRPFPAPVTPNKVDVPASAIASADAFAAFVASVAPGSWFKMPAASVSWAYGMVLSGKRNLLIDASGFTLKVTGAPNGDATSVLTFRDCQDVSVQGLTADGGYPGVPTLPGSGEATHLVNLSGWFGRAPSKRIEVAGFVGTNGWSDGVYIEGQNGGDFPPAEDIWVHHSSFVNVGRNCLSLINCDRVLFEDNTSDRTNYHVVDFEPNFSTEQTTNVTVRRNRFGSYAHRPGLIGFFVAAAGRGIGAQIGQIEISDNTLAGIARNGYDGQPRGITTLFGADAAMHFRDIKFLRNTSPQPLKPDSFYATYCDGVTIAGVPSGSIQTPNCTGVVVS